MTINLGEIAAGDEVKLQGNDGNLISARVQVDLRQNALFVHAFGTRIYFARHTRGGWQRMSSITVIGHQPSLFGSSR